MCIIVIGIIVIPFYFTFCLIFSYCSYINIQTGAVKVDLYKGSESAFVQQVKVLGSETGQGPLNRVIIVLRIPVSDVGYIFVNIQLQVTCVLLYCLFKGQIFCTWVDFTSSAVIRVSENIYHS